MKRDVLYWQPPLLLHDRTAKRMTQMVRQMCYDDVLLRGWQWRLEYLSLDDGFPHYRLVYRNMWVVGLVDIRSPARLGAIQRDLGALLAGYGWTPERTRLVQFAARTPLDASKHYLPHLLPSKASFAKAPVIAQ